MLGNIDRDDDSLDSKTRNLLGEKLVGWNSQTVVIGLGYKRVSLYNGGITMHKGVVID